MTKYELNHHIYRNLGKVPMKVGGGAKQNVSHEQGA